MNATSATRMHSSCPVCNGIKLNALWEVNGYSIARCHTCTLVFVQNQVTVEELASHYATSDVSYDDTNAECLDYYYQKLAGLIRKRFPEPGKILDLGCSRGWFLDVMTGWECHGSEISASDSAAARERYGDRIVTGAFEDYPIREGYFDVITMQDVFDHFRDPMPTLEKCLRLLRPGGLIVIKVHNISCLYAKLTGPKFYAVIPPTHLFYYDDHSLGRALSNSGFQVVDSKFIGHLLKVKTVFWRLSQSHVSQSNVNSPYYRIYKAVDHTALGEMAFHKNLHDIITVLAVKPASDELRSV